MKVTPAEGEIPVREKVKGDAAWGTLERLSFLKATIVVLRIWGQRHPEVTRAAFHDFPGAQDAFQKYVLRWIERGVITFSVAFCLSCR
jgi:hypothetical protein